MCVLQECCSCNGMARMDERLSRQSLSFPGAIGRTDEVSLSDNRKERGLELRAIIVPSCAKTMGWLG